LANNHDFAHFCGCNLYVNIIKIDGMTISVKGLNAAAQKVGPMPIVVAYLEKMQLRPLLQQALPHLPYVQGLELLLKSVLVEPMALYRLVAWGQGWDPRGIGPLPAGDDAVGRALERLFAADRASLLTAVVLQALEAFHVQVEQLHNDSTTVSFAGAYLRQKPMAVQLRRGVNKDHRPDLKQLVYSLTISADGAVPVHYKAYHGNRTDDTTHWETWQQLGRLLGRSDFLYVADCKLCVHQTLLQIDAQQGQFITTLPALRSETERFHSECLASLVRWEVLWKRRCARARRRLETFEVAGGFYQMSEGFRLYWYRSSEKIQRDASDRQERLERAQRQLHKLTQRRRNEGALRKAAQKILAKNRVESWIQLEVRWSTKTVYKRRRRRTPGEAVSYQQVRKKIPTLDYQLDEAAIARAKVLDGVFPLATNTKLSALEVLKKYKYQPFLEKRHALLKNTLQVAPVFLKNNDRVEALMLVYFFAQLLSALMERTVRQNMRQQKISALPILPEGRLSKTPTTEQLFAQFDHCQCIHILHDGQLLKVVREPLTELQKQLLQLLEVDPKVFA
jgi:transposase